MPHRAPSILVVFGALAVLSVSLRAADPKDSKVHALGKGGQVELAAPADYVATAEPRDTLVLSPPKDPGVALRFNLHYADAKELPDDLGPSFVRKQAQTKKLAVIEKEGKVYFSETNSGEEKGVKVERQFWQIGFGRAVVVMSATVVAEKRDGAAVKECLEKHVPAIIESLKIKK